ncbi:MAG: universal stress protein [Dehalococcoidales bacterium]|nr:universal stress protein [Dehalococcoidales bacterium]
MFNRILLPLDGSEISEKALVYGEELAGVLGYELVLYHVQGHEHILQEHMHQVYLDNLAERLRIRLNSTRPAGRKINVTTRIDVGVPSENICNMVDKNKIDLIVMAAVSTSGLKVGKMLGSVSDNICQTVPVPVMLVRPQVPAHVPVDGKLLRHFLITTDGSDLSKLAIPVGTELAEQLHADITAFRMATMLRLYDDGVYPGTFIDYEKFNDIEKTRVTAEMTTLENELKSKGLAAISLVTSGYDAAYEIIEICKKESIDLVVMSTHGQSGLGRWIFGSVAEKVLRHGETPLLLVHARAG